MFSTPHFVLHTTNMKGAFYMLDPAILVFIAITYTIIFLVLVLIHFSFHKRLIPIIQPYMSIVLGLVTGLFIISLYDLPLIEYGFTMILLGILVSFGSSWFAKYLIKAPTLYMSNY